MAGIFGRGRRRRIRDAYDALCAAMAAADGVSSAAAEDVRRRHLDALVELWLRTEGIDGAAALPELRGLLTNPEFTQVVRAVEADRSATARRPADALPELDEIVATATPGSAGRAEDWLGKHGEHEGVNDVPPLWRIGTGRLGPAGEPFEVALPLLDESHVQISSHPTGRAAALGLVENLLMRVVSHFRPGLVALHVWDVEHLTGPLPRLHPLTRSGILHVHDPAGLPHLLDDMSDRIRRVHREVLSKGETTLAGLTRSQEARTEPWVVVVLVGNRQALREEEHKALGRIARGGLACGVQLVLLDVPMAIGAPVETLDIDDGGIARTSMTGPYVRVELEERFAEGPVGNGCHAIAAEHDSWRSRIATFDELLMPKDVRWEASSKTGLKAPVGFDDAGKVEILLDDSSPHALVGGPSGSGKTNLLLAWIGALTTRYSPDELELYLLDFKEGVSFAQFAPGRRDTTWLPHAQLIGINVNDDREFGLALLQYLSDEMRRRAAAAKEREVTKLEDLRDADPKGRWPRVVAVIDEFQYLFAETDPLSRAALTLLEDIARRGRSQGIHLVLASQDVSGIAAFWGRPAIFEQFVLRLALPRARRVLDDQRNEATLDLPRWHAVINHESGLRHGNRIARMPNASTRGLFDKVQGEMLERWGAGTPPRLFDGSRSPRVDYLLNGIGPEQRRAPVGQTIDLYASPAIVELSDAPGRNLAVLGAGADSAERVLATAAAGMIKGYAPDTVDVVLAALVEESEGPVAGLQKWLAREGHEARVEVIRLRETKEAIEKLAKRTRDRLAAGERGRTVVVLFGADAADSVLDRSGTEALRALVHFGPETGLHVLGWWRSVSRLKALLTMGAVVDDIGAWVALDVQGAELLTLLPGSLLSWSPRAGRALFFDRAQHALPHVIVVSGESPDVAESNVAESGETP